MNNKAMRLLMLTLVLPFIACNAGPIDKVSVDDVTGTTSSALSGGPWTWVNTATLRCLDSDPSGSVYTLACNGGSYQLWTNTPGTYGDQIRDLATGRCLDSDTSGSAYTLSCNGGSFQQWTVSYMGVYGWQIRNVATGRCLDSDSNGSVYTLGCNGGNFQRWK